MIWYLLSPIRGTTDPPRLPARHPIRRAFYRHGKGTAQHWLVTMLVSVAVAMGFSYPTIFLSSNPTAGLASSPHHVWTVAKAINDAEAQVDIEMRQIWVHGSYMDALNKNVLKQALAVQQRLITDERLHDHKDRILNSIDNENGLRWGYHSPLIYWNNSAEAIDSDSDILKTINEQKRSSSSLNLQLRPASVFAGKKFARRHELIAADAIVITLLSKGTTGTGRDWQDRMRDWNGDICEDCTWFPRDGHVTLNRVFEFSFMPLSLKEHAALTFAYSAMAVYVLLSLRRMKAFHSRFGLVVTAITQMTCSILASFTICGILRINLSMIPRNAYPFVVLVLGIENMFRLINAVLAYPSTMATELRIANALGDVGPLSVAAAAQNLMILFLLSRVVSPGVAAFCAFAAIATLFDAFFLLSFFVAVLNVDIRRLELSDHLNTRHNQPRHRRRRTSAQHSWFEALVRGRLPFSTRMAGTAVTTTFILSLNYHFFEHEENYTNLRHLLGLEDGSLPQLRELDTFAFPPMNATLTPVEWMHMQDFDTAKEVMRLAKPGADSFIVRLYAPLVVVLGGSNRTHDTSGGAEWAHALRSFTLHHFYPVAVAVVFAVTFVAVLMNFLLFNEAGDEENNIALEELEDTLAWRTIALPHKLDIVKMAGNENGHCVTAALDRTMAVLTLDPWRQTHYITSLPPAVLQTISWPIHHLAIDNEGDWIACHCSDDSIMAFNTTTGATVANLVQYPDDHPSILFYFVSLPTSAGSMLYFIVLTSGGRLAMTCMADGESSGIDISTVPLVGAAIVETTISGRQMISVTEQGEYLSHTWSNGAWIQSKLHLSSLVEKHAGPVSSVTIQQHLDSNTIVVTTKNKAIFLSGNDLSHISTFLEAADFEIQRLLLGSSRKCPACGGTAFRKIAVLGSLKSQEGSVLTTWSAGNEIDAAICLTGDSSSCDPWSEAIGEQHLVGDIGVWCAATSQSILGLRKHQQQPEPAEVIDKRRPTVSQLRRRRHARQTLQVTDDRWEAYSLSITGDLETTDIEPSDTEVDAALYVNSAGPAVAIDTHSIAIAFGNAIRLLRTERISGARTPHSRQQSTSRVIARDP